MEIDTPTIQKSEITLSDEDVKKLIPESEIYEYDERSEVAHLFVRISSTQAYQIDNLMKDVETNIHRIEVVNTYLEENKLFLTKLQNIQKKEAESQIHRVECFDDENHVERNIGEKIVSEEIEVES